MNMKHMGGAEPFPSPDMADLIDLDILFDRTSKADVYRNKISAGQSL